jgi:hypothetical protein
MKKPQIILLTSMLSLIAILTAIYIFLNPKNAIVRTSKKHLGEEENPGNVSFKNAEFEKKMTDAGWYSSAQWCSYFAKMVFKNSLFGKRKTLADNLFSGSSQLTWANFKADTSGMFETSDTPKKGSIVIWQSLSDVTKGHVGIVLSHNKDYFKTIEGNSNNIIVNLKDLKKNIKKDQDNAIETNTSEGAVAYHIRQYDGDGMKLLGFINII